MKQLTMLVFSAFFLSGCACAKNSATTAHSGATATVAETEAKSSNQPNETKAIESETTQKAPQVVNPCPGERMEYKGKVTLKGQVGSTKGAQLTLKGVILRIEDRQEARQWVGKTVTATGDLCHYTCGPMEQCLTSGSIPSLKNITITEDPARP